MGFMKNFGEELFPSFVTVEEGKALKTAPSTINKTTAEENEQPPKSILMKIHI